METPNQRREQEISEQRHFEEWARNQLNLATWHQLCELSVFPERRLVRHFSISREQAGQFKEAARQLILARWREEDNDDE